jgi:hypothetical protein
VSSIIVVVWCAKALHGLASSSSIEIDHKSGKESEESCRIRDNEASGECNQPRNSVGSTGIFVEGSIPISI